MPDSGIAELNVIDDPNDMIRRRADWYAGGTPHGRHMALGLASDLLVDGAAGVMIKTVGDWWIVSADRDWLLDDVGVPRLDYFSRIISLPAVGQFAIRREVVIAALCPLVLTGSRNGLDWIVGEAAGVELPPDVTASLAHVGSGRMVAFVAATLE